MTVYHLIPQRNFITYLINTYYYAILRQPPSQSFFSTTPLTTLQHTPCSPHAPSPPHPPLPSVAIALLFSPHPPLNTMLLCPHCSQPFDNLTDHLNRGCKLAKSQPDTKRKHSTKDSSKRSRSNVIRQRKGTKAIEALLTSDTHNAQKTSHQTNCPLFPPYATEQIKNATPIHHPSQQMTTHRATTNHLLNSQINLLTTLLTNRQIHMRNRQIYMRNQTKIITQPTKIISMTKIIHSSKNLSDSSTPTFLIHLIPTA